MVGAEDVPNFVSLAHAGRVADLDQPLCDCVLRLPLGQLPCKKNQRRVLNKREVWLCAISGKRDHLTPVAREGGAIGRVLRDGQLDVGRSGTDGGEFVGEVWRWGRTMAA